MFRRLAILAAITASVLAAAIPAAASSTDAASPWLQTGYNAAGSYANLTEHVITRGNVSTLTTRLSVAGTRRNGQCFPGVDATAIGDSRFYVVNCGVVSARSLVDGSVLWQRTLPHADFTFFRQVLVADGKVVVIGQTGGDGSTEVQGSVDVFDEDNGQRRYHQAPPGLSAEVSGDYLVLHIYASPQQRPYTTVERVADGSIVWHTPYGGAAYCENEEWTIGGHVYLKSCSRLRALDVATGAFAWRRLGDYTVQAGDSDTPDARHLWVYDNDRDRLVDLNPATGATRTAFATPASNVLAVTPTRVFAADRSNVYAYDAATGEQLWRSQRSVWFAAAWADGLLFLDSGTVLDAASGGVRAVLPVTYNSPLSGVRAVGNGNVAVLTGYPSRLNLLAPA